MFVFSVLSNRAVQRVHLLMCALLVVKVINYSISNVCHVVLLIVMPVKTTSVLSVNQDCILTTKVNV